MMSKRGCGSECLAKLAHAVGVRISLQGFLGIAFVRMSGIFRKVRLFFFLLNALLCVLPSFNPIVSMPMFPEKSMLSLSDRLQP